jgi:hypothetical protein
MTWKIFYIIWGFGMIVVACVFLYKKRPTRTIVFFVGGIYNIVLGIGHP